MKKCIRCKELKGFSEFRQIGIGKKGAMAYCSYCRKCVTARAIEWKKNHPERIKKIYCADSTWVNGQYICCGSKSPRVHKIACKNIIKGEDDYSDLTPQGILCPIA